MGWNAVSSPLPLRYAVLSARRPRAASKTWEFPALVFCQPARMQQVSSGTHRPRGKLQASYRGELGRWLLCKRLTGWSSARGAPADEWPRNISCAFMAHNGCSAAYSVLPRAVWLSALRCSLTSCQEGETEVVPQTAVWVTEATMARVMVPVLRLSRMFGDHSDSNDL